MRKSSYVTFETPVNAENLLGQIKGMLSEDPHYEIEEERVQMAEGSGILEDDVLKTEKADAYVVRGSYRPQAEGSQWKGRTLARFYVDDRKGEEVATSVILNFPLQPSHEEHLESGLRSNPNPDSLEGY